jgi:retron-type reverse transcriptase
LLRGCAGQLTQGQTRWSIPLFRKTPNPSLVTALARSFLAGDQTVEGILSRSGRTLGRQWRWLGPVAQRYVQTFADRVRPRQRDVVRFLLDDSGFKRAWSRLSDRLSVEEWLTEPQRMQPIAAARNWNIPVIESVGTLAAWLHLSVGELEWFADLKGLQSKRCDARLAHYHYRLLTKKSGKIRMIEAPKPRLKEIQRQVLSGILDLIPAHPAAHGFVKGRSIKTFAAPHVARRVVLRMDLQDFFPSLAARRIQAFFRTAGYPESVADLLGGLCTNAVGFRAWFDMGKDLDIDRALLKEARFLYSRPHLPQGAPTSPALANLCAYRIDCRLTGLAQSAGAQYTRYADDLAFSGDEAFDRSVERFKARAAAILLEEGFSVNHHKTRVMRQGVQQRLAGIVVNQRLNVARTEVDRLKAILTNCVRHGPESQNRAAHSAFQAYLEGRVGFVETINPTKGVRLRGILEQIRW